ncbi:L-aspartate oxidase [Thermocrinis minervae]|uniref:L-aspartate oxidase n=1 Tax=Thermocrinis minervae TaxID=381751 RepID=A0A1M6SFP7_9AQUI|nr:L-aspartate oxidase [Thermocrinis minervae]SHK43562.1 L-aspartate oxidase [Thermocrinis minervae]
MQPFLKFETPPPEEEVDILVCGSGIAGLTCSIVLKELGFDPLIVTRGWGNTYYSQGGIACASLPQDSPYLHFLDTQRAGRGLCDEKNLWILVDEGVQRLYDLRRWGVIFDPDTTLEGGHSFPRVFKVKDYTGRAINEALLRRAKALGVKIVEGVLEELLVEEGRLWGAIVKDGESYRLVSVKVLVLSTGGASSMFLHTSNPQKVRGDSMGTALRIGAHMRNLEFIQFHPTVVKGTNLLISEAVRGEGAILVDERGERFVDELQPRDLVSRAIYKKLKEGHQVYIDLRPLIRKGIQLEERFPTILSELRKLGYDPYSEPIPVVPAAHYFIGGIYTDSYGRTTVENLYAVGECASTGVHGANRLASNSLLEGVVFGYRTAYAIANNLQHVKRRKFRLQNSREEKFDPPFNFTDLKKLMWESCGMERDEGSLKEGIRQLSLWLEGYHLWKSTPENRSLLDIGLLALATLKCALERRESRGVHYRRDFPQEREEFRKDTFYSLS